MLVESHISIVIEVSEVQKSITGEENFLKLIPPFMWEFLIICIFEYARSLKLPLMLGFS